MHFMNYVYFNLIVIFYFTQKVLEHGKNVSSSDDDSDESDDQAKKKKRKKSATERREAARLEEERLQRVEKELLDPNRQLSSCDDFDRMVLATPDSSAVWLQYMAFHLQVRINLNDKMCFIICNW